MENSSAVDTACWQMPCTAYYFISDIIRQLVDD